MAVDRHFWSSWLSRVIAFAIVVGLSLGEFSGSAQAAASAAAGGNPLAEEGGTGY